MDDVEPSDSISNAPRRGSDISGYTDGNAYVLLDLPDLSKDARTTSGLSVIHQTDSVRSLGDVIMDRNSSVDSNGQVHDTRQSDAVNSACILHFVVFVQVMLFHQFMIDN